MSAQILSGESLAEKIKLNIHKEIEKLIEIKKTAPGLAVILVGNDHASQIYVEKKAQACKQVSIDSHLYKLAENTSEAELINLIKKLNNNKTIHGILLQLPLPKHLKSENILSTISPHKDVDGFHELNIGKLVLKKPCLQACTPLGIIKLLESINYNFEGAEAVVVGASNIVGRPIAIKLLNKGATVTICHHLTKSIQQHVQTADLLVVAVGKSNLIKGEWIKQGATVIDVGISRLEGDIICGDVEFEQARQKAAYITPVPGGVGPMTVAILMHNTFSAYKAAFSNMKTGLN